MSETTDTRLENLKSWCHGYLGRETVPLDDGSWQETHLYELFSYPNNII